MDNPSSPSRRLGGRFDLPLAALDGNHSSEELGGRNRGVVVAKPVAACDQARRVETVRAAHHPVDEQSTLLREKHDFSRRNFVQAGALDGN